MSHSEEKSHNKHVINTEMDHPNPNINLMGKNLTLEEISKKTNNNTHNSNLVTTDTNYEFDFFANKKKMVPESEMKPFDKDLYCKTERKKSDDDISNYLKKDDKTEKNDSDKYSDRYTEKNNDTIKPSNYGPSFGSGPTIEDNKSDGRSDDKSKKDGEFESEEEEMLAKLNMLRKLGELTQYGVKLSQNYNMKSNYKAMKYEYELHRSIRDKKNGVKWLSNLMLNACYGLELANEKFNPFEFKLKGWSEQMAEEQADYYDVFGELYEKYFKAGKPIPPEIKLMFMISGSAIKFHLANVAMNSLPNLGNMMNANPELADQLRQQAVSDKIKQQNMKQRQAFNDASMKEHENANMKASDINMLKEKQQEFMRMQQEKNSVRLKQQELMEKQRQLDDLERRLNAQRSDTRSLYSRNNGSYHGSYNGSYNGNNGNNDNNNTNVNQKRMKPPTLPSSLRQQSINEQRERLKNMEMNRNNIHVNPDFDNIISDKIKDDYSKIDEVSTLDHSDLRSSEESKSRSRKRNRLRNKLKIDTSV